MPTFTSQADIYTITAAGSYTFDMLGGDDWLNVYGGTTIVAHLGDGADFAVLKAGQVTIYGDAGNDRFDIFVSNATVDGGADSDLFNLRGGPNATASGGTGDDRFNFLANTTSATVHGGDGDDDFLGYGHSVSGTLYGDAGNDYFVQFTSGVILSGGVGNDLYRVTVTGPATIVEFLGEGIDAVQVARGYSYTLPDNVENMSVQGFTGSVLTAATLTGNSINNIIVAGNNDETIHGLGGNDRIAGKGGNDIIHGDAGNDYLDGGSGNDTLTGGDGNDTLQGRAGSDEMTGGAGDDSYYVDSLSDLVVEAATEGTETVRVSVSGYTLTANVENGIILGTGAGMTLTGNALDNVLTGNVGNDTLNGGPGGSDILKGGAGHDDLTAYSGSTLYGGTGDDTYHLDASLGSVATIVELGDEGTDMVYITTQAFNYSFALPDNVENCSANDGGNAVTVQITGNAQNNILTVVSGNLSFIDGGGGNDTLVSTYGYINGQDGDDVINASGILTGGNGHDVITGGGGNDDISGNDGNDTLAGGQGSDQIHGGSGSDIFRYATTADSTAFAYDTIYDFETGVDKVDFSMIDANAGLAGDQAFTYGASSSGQAGEAWFVTSSGHTYVYLDYNGGGADMVIEIVGSVNAATDVFW